MVDRGGWGACVGLTAMVLLSGGCTDPFLLTDANPEPAADSSGGAADWPGPPGGEAGGTLPSADSGGAVDEGVDEGATGSDTGMQFLLQPDITHVPSCDPFANDCPRGEKCTFWSASGGGSWDSTRCVPIVDNPDGDGEPCEVLDGPTSGFDTCDAQMMCWNVDAETDVGHCVGICIGSADSPTCDNPCSTCSVSGGPLAICLAQCDPVLQDCPAGQACYAVADQFSCAPDVSGEVGNAGQACEFVNVCSEGTICVSPDVWPPGACEPGSGCCVPTCDTLAADPCPGTPEGVVCVPWWADGQRPPQTACHDWSTTGICALP